MEPIGVAELQLNRDSSVVAQVRPPIQIRPVPSPNAALGKTANAVKRTSSTNFHKFSETKMNIIMNTILLHQSSFCEQILIYTYTPANMQ